MKGWDLVELRKEGMKTESVSQGEERISHASVSKIGSYSYKNIDRKNEETSSWSEKSQKKCYRCGEVFNSRHLSKCKAKKVRCSKCDKIGHFAKVCNQKDIKILEDSSEKDSNEEDVYAHSIYGEQKLLNVHLDSHTRSTIFNVG